MEPAVDSSVLRTRAYADSRHLATRRDIYQYRTTEASFGGWALSHLPHDLGRVLDVGCGPGAWMAMLAERHTSRALVGIDLSHGMLKEVDVPRALRCVADAENLPLGDGYFDTTLCIHMLYHVPDVDKAIGELRRVTGPEGVVLVATNGGDHMSGFRRTFDEVVEAMTKQPSQILTSMRRFRMEEGEGMLAKHFGSVSRDDFQTELEVPEPQPVIDYMESVRAFHEQKLPEDISWEEAMSGFGDRVRQIIAREGVFRSPVHAGVYVCGP